MNSEDVPGGFRVYSRILTGTGVYSIGVIASRMTSFLLLPIYTRYLTPNDYGVLELLELTLFVFGTLVGMRIGDALMYEWAEARNNPARQGSVVCTAYVTALLLGVVAVAVGWALSPFLSVLVFGGPGYVSAFRLMFWSFGASLPLEVGLSYARARDCRKHYLAFSLGRLAVTALLNLFFLIVLRWGYEAMLWGGIAGASSLSLAAGWYCMTGFSWLSSFSAAMLRKIVRYGAPLGFSGLGFLIIHYGDRFFLREHVSLAEIGIYSLAYKIGMLVANLQTPFDVYWRARMFDIVKRPDGERIFVRVCTYLTLALMCFVVFLVAFAPLMMRFLAGPAFQKAAEYVPWIGLAYVIRAVGGHFRSVFLLEGRTGEDALVVWVSALICLVGYALLIPKFFFWGAVAATGLAFSVMLAFGLWRAERLRHFPFEYGRLILAFGAALPLALLMRFLHPVGAISQLLAGCGICAGYVAILLAAGFIQPDEWDGLHRAIGRLRSRMHWNVT